ncbi:MAG TPA: hypothetical protein VHK69_15365, partial [Chitinophagaceae bacterium]|nr:hypothetical protein [Chitinophagaceae bacterium]
MKKIAFFLLLTGTVLACSKDKFQTKPQLRLKSHSGVVANNQESFFQAIVEYTDKEGDIQDSFYFKKTRINLRETAVSDSDFYFKVPEFPARTQGELQVSIPGTAMAASTNPRIPGSDPAVNENDTLIVKMVARDKAGNWSDTLIINNV